MPPSSTLPLVVPRPCMRSTQSARWSAGSGWQRAIALR